MQPCHLLSGNMTKSRFRFFCFFFYFIIHHYSVFTVVFLFTGLITPMSDYRLIRRRRGKRVLPSCCVTCKGKVGSGGNARLEISVKEKGNGDDKSDKRCGRIERRSVDIDVRTFVRVSWIFFSRIKYPSVSVRLRRESPRWSEKTCQTQS